MEWVCLFIRRMIANPVRSRDEKMDRADLSATDRAIDLFTRALRRTRRIDGILDVISGSVDLLTRFFRRSFLPARHQGRAKRKQTEGEKQFGFHKL
jgi:hypothetical protein